MTPDTFARYKRESAAKAHACETQGHDWAPVDECTGRRHCRRCPAYLPGRPDAIAARLRQGFVAEPLNWIAVAPLESEP